jgi:hypothetical protein
MASPLAFGLLEFLFLHPWLLAKEFVEEEKVVPP